MHVDHAVQLLCWQSSEHPTALQVRNLVGVRVLDLAKLKAEAPAETSLRSISNKVGGAPTQYE